MVEIGNSAMKHACERAQVICAAITMRSAIPRPHLASQGWHCQGLLAQRGFPPPSSGTARISGQKPLRIGSARDYWRRAGSRQPALAVPGITGAGRVLATQRWHCQNSVARGGSSSLLHIPVSDWHVTELAIASIIDAMQDRRRRVAHGAIRSDAQLDD